MSATNLQNFSGDVQIRGTTLIKANTATDNLAIGTEAGLTAQTNNTVAIGTSAGKTSQGDNAIAVGRQAGEIVQGAKSIAVGREAGQTSQGTFAVAVGSSSGMTSQGAQAVAVGWQAGLTVQGANTTAVGREAGKTSQGASAVAVGSEAGETSQGAQTVAVGLKAGNSEQGSQSVAVGTSAGQTSQGVSAVAIGWEAGDTEQGTQAVAMGRHAGRNAQGIQAVAVGWRAGSTQQGTKAVAVGSSAGQTSQGEYAVAAGNQAGYSEQGASAVAIGVNAGATSQSMRAVAVGAYSGNSEQGEYAVAMGWTAGMTSQGNRATALGHQAGYSEQGTYAVAVGYQAGQTSQGAYATAVGLKAGNSEQGSQSIAVGSSSGYTSQGASAVAIGWKAGETAQGANSIILNGTGSAFNATTASSFNVKPVRGGNYAASALAYTSAGEIVEETNMHFDTSGNVGIGTTTPQQRLEVNGNILLGIGQNNSFIHGGDVTALSSDTTILIVSDANDTDGATTGDIIFGVGSAINMDTNRDFTFAQAYPSNVPRLEHMRIEGSTGDVGIGTSNPGCRLDVQDNTEGSFLGRFKNTSTGTDQDARVLIQTSDGSGESQLLLGTTNESTSHTWNLASGSGITPSFIIQYGVTTDYNGGSSAFEIVHGGGVRITGVEGSGDYNSDNYGYTAAGLDGNPNQQNFGLDVKSGSIRSNGGLVAYSDRRIKSNIVDINDTHALDQIRAIQPRYYEYVDKRKKGSSSVIGFIAQEVKEVIPRAVSVANGRIPNIYSFANINASNVLTFTDFNTSTLDSNATTEIEVYINGKDVRNVTISEIIDEHSIRVVEDISEWGCSFDENGNVVSEIVNTILTLDEYNTNTDLNIAFSPNISGYKGANVIISVDEYNSLEDKTGYTEVIESYNKTYIRYPGNQIFVWGQCVLDFHHINKDYIWTVAAAALQEVDRQLQAEKIKVVSLESQLTSVLERLDALEGA